MELETAAGSSGKLLLGVLLGLAVAWMLLSLDKRAPRIASHAVIALGSIGLIAAALVAAFLFGLSPALSHERELVSFIRVAYQDRPGVQRAIRMLDDSLYLSTGDVQSLIAAVERSEATPHN